MNEAASVAVDTVKLRSPYITQELAQAVTCSLVTRQAIDNASGELLYEIVQGPLMGTWDSRVSCTVRYEEWDNSPAPFDIAKKRLGVEVPKRQPRLLPSEPYIQVEASVHKGMLGHNVEGGPVDVRGALRWFIRDIAGRVQVELPAPDGWTIERIDWAEVYDLSTPEAVQDYVNTMSLASFPRRKMGKWSDESLQFAGDTTTIKLYHKGPEFKKHDRVRLRKCFGEERQGEIHVLYRRAQSLLRCEVEIKPKKFDYDFGRKPLVGELEAGYCEAVYEREMVRLLGEGSKSMEVVRTFKEVEYRLREFYSSRGAAALFATWVKLSAVGEEATSRIMAGATLRRHKKMLREAGIEWKGTDVVLRERALQFPTDFRPVLADSRRVVDVDPKVIEFCDYANSRVAVS